MAAPAAAARGRQAATALPAASGLVARWDKAERRLAAQELTAPPSMAAMPAAAAAPTALSGPPCRSQRLGPGLFRLNVSGQSALSAPGFGGLRFQRVTPFGGMVLSPILQVAYVHEFAPYRNQVGTLASLPGSTFLVDGARPARDAAQVKAGAELALGPPSALFANFDGEFWRDQLYAGKGGFRYVW